MNVNHKAGICFYVWLQRLRLWNTIVLSIALILSAEIAAAEANGQQPHILFINSYHVGYAWTDSIVSSFTQEIRSAFPYARLSVEFMDAKRHVLTAAYADALAELYQAKYGDDALDVVVASDDAAFGFIRRRGSELFPGTTIVFAGVNDFDDSMTRGMASVTGITEHNDYRGTISAALTLQPDLERLVVVSDSTISGQTRRKDVERLVGEYADRISIDFLDSGGGMTWPRLRSALSSLSPHTAVLFLDFFRDATGTYFPPTELMPRIAEITPVPIYVLADFFVGLGAVGGSVSSGSDQGTRAADAVIKILRGVPASSMPVVTKDIVHYMFDYRMLKRFHLSPSALPPESTVIHRPFAFYREYTALVWSVFFVFLLLVMLVVIVNGNARRRRIVNRRLTEINEHLWVTLRSIGDAVITTDRDGRITSLNPVAEELTGWTSREAQELPVEQVFHIVSTRTEMESENPVKRVLAEERAVGMSNGTVLIRKNGERIQIADSGAPIQDTDGQLLGVVMVFRDVTEEYRLQEELREEERRLRESQAVAKVGTWELDLQSRRMWASREALRLYGIAESNPWVPFELARSAPVAEDRPRLDQELQQLLSNGGDYDIEFTLRTVDTGLERRIRSQARLQRDSSGSPLRVIGTIQDISDHVHARERLEAAVREKAVLVQEVHHRVKNNLQVVISMMNLQKRRLSERRSQLVLQESQSRVQAMALLHEILYRSDDLSSLDLGAYLSSVAAHTFESFDISDGRIELECRTDHSWIDMDRAIPCGLIANELVTNSLKYAFPAGGSGTVRLRQWEEDGALVFQVSDDGIGLPQEFDPHARDTLGMELVFALAEQIRAAVRWSSEGGCSFTISLARNVRA